MQIHYNVHLRSKSKYSGKSLTGIATYFSNSLTYRKRYASSTTAEFMRTMSTSLTGRSVDE